MTEREGSSLETVIEELCAKEQTDGQSGVIKQNSTSARRQSPKRTKKVVVNIPLGSVSKEEGNKTRTNGTTVTKHENSKASVSFSFDKENEQRDYIRTPRESNNVQSDITESEKATNDMIVYDSFSRSSTDVSIKTTKKKTKRPKSSAGLTKQDLDFFLPRKSFYNSHDKALVEAGKQTDILRERKKPNWRSILKMHTMEELYPVDPKPEEIPNVAPLLFDESDEDDATGLDNVETAMSADGQTTTVKPKRKAKNKTAAAEKEEYKQLYDYLKYIIDHPDEYIAMTKYTPKNTDYRHPNNFVRLGRVYRRYSSSNVKNSMLLHAVNGLKTTAGEANTQRTPRASGNKSEKLTADGGEGQVEETEIEKIRSRTEKWMKTLSTHQMMRVKELALKDVGEEDTSMSRWWQVFKTCKYLRTPAHHVWATNVEAQ